MSNRRKKYYTVILAGSSGEIIERILHRSPNLAARAAQQMHLTATLVSVETRWNILGNCRKCEAVILDSEIPKELPSGDLLCESCK